MHVSVKHATLLAVAAAGALLVGCQQEQTADMPEPTRYGEFSLAPRVLFRQPSNEVASYLDQFKNLADSDSSPERRVVQVRDQDRVLTAVLSGDFCDEVHLTGRLGDSIFPKSALDFIKLRDAYGGAELYWPCWPILRITAKAGRLKVAGKPGSRWTDQPSPKSSGDWMSLTGEMGNTK